MFKTARGLRFTNQSDCLIKALIQSEMNSPRIVGNNSLNLKIYIFEYYVNDRDQVMTMNLTILDWRNSYIILTTIYINHITKYDQALMDISSPDKSSRTSDGDVFLPPLVLNLYLEDFLNFLLKGTFEIEPEKVFELNLFYQCLCRSIGGHSIF